MAYVGQKTGLCFCTVFCFDYGLLQCLITFLQFALGFLNFLVFFKEQFVLFVFVKKVEADKAQGKQQDGKGTPCKVEKIFLFLYLEHGHFCFLFLKLYLVLLFFRVKFNLHTGYAFPNI